MLGGFSTRARIMVATGLAALPLVGLIAFSAAGRYSQDQARAETRATNRADLIATLLAEGDAPARPSPARLRALLDLGVPAATSAGTGVVIYRGGRPSVRAGPAGVVPPAADPDVAAALARRAGVFSATGDDGVERVWGLKRVGDGPLTVAFGLPAAVIHGPARAALRRDLLLAALSVVAVLLAAFLLAGRVTAPIRRLAANFGDGENGGSNNEVGAIERGVRRAVNERAKLEVQLRQAQKMEAIGLLAGGVAHDFNNLLTVISGYSEIARRQLGAGPAVAELEEIERAAERAAVLTRQLLTFARQQAIDPVLLDLNQIVSGLLPMLGRLIGEDINVVTLTGEDLPAVLADRAQLEQVVVNLAINARDAMPTGGILTIETRTIDLDEGYTREHARVEGGTYVCLVVTDTGVGISPEQVERIFEPFYTTKEVGEGTGLGLATVHGIALQSGGHVQVYSEPELGSTFKVYLPAVAVTLRPGPPAREQTTGHLEGSETVLLCEDEDLVRVLIERILVDAGYTVLAGRNPHEALELGAAHHDSIAALITDVILPDMSGPQLAARLQTELPGLRTVFLSGYTLETVRERGKLPVGSAFLEKPFHAHTLLRLVRDQLDQRARVAARGTHGNDDAIT